MFFARYASRHSCMMLAMACLGLTGSNGAQAATNYAYVSSGGSDNGNTSCTRAVPCLTINAALNNLNEGGEVIIIGDGYQDASVTVAKSATIRAEISALITSGINVNAGVSGRVTFKNLRIRNSTAAYTAVVPALLLQTAADVLVIDCEVSDTAFSSRFISNENGAIHISPTSGSMRVTLERVSLFNNIIGVAVEGPASSAHLKVFHSLFLGNRTAAIRVTGAGNDAMIASSQLLGSAKAIDLQNGGTARSYGDNVITNGDAPIPTPLN